MENEAMSIIGFLFTLISLLGTFFYVQLSGWLSEVLALNKKYEMNKAAANPEQRSELRDCRYTFKKLFNIMPIATTLAMAGFLFYISKKSFALLSILKPGALTKLFVGDALTFFLVLTTILFLLIALSGIVYFFKLKSLNA